MDSQTTVPRPFERSGRLSHDRIIRSGFDEPHCVRSIQQPAGLHRDRVVDHAAFQLNCGISPGFRFVERGDHLSGKLKLVI